MKVVLSGGGTGGHVLPVLAVASALKHEKPDVEILFIGSRGGLEQKIVESANLRAVYINAGKFRRYRMSLFRKLIDLPTNIRNVRDLFKFVAGFGQAYSILKKEKPDAVFIKGGYVGLPVGLAAAALKIPFAVHESDAVVGLSNRILSKWANSVFVSFPFVWGLPADRLTYTGSPVREDIGTHTRDEGYDYFAFTKSMPVVFIIGGSQGAHKINEAVIEVMDELLARVQVIHGTGEQDYQKALSRQRLLSADLRPRYAPFAFLGKEMAYAFAAADLVVSRSGGGIFEIAASGKPSLLIPLSHSTNDHQLKNAQVFAREGASHVLLDEELSGKQLLDEIFLLLDNLTKRKEMAAAALRLSDPKAAFRIAVHLLNLRRRSK